MKRPIFLVVVILTLFCVLTDRQSVSADCRSFSSLIHNGGFVLADRDGEIISSCNESTLFVPASILKIPLALAAFDILGPSYRFVTEFFLDRLDNLYIRGYGDPFLVSEEVDLVLDRLKDMGVDVVKGIYVDDGSAMLAEKAPGRGQSDNPYDVPVTAVAVNFNTVNILVHADGTVESAEAQTPTLPIMKELGRGLSAGRYRLNICRGDCQPETESARYATQLFRALQRQKGITGDGSMGIGAVPPEASLVYTHRNTRTLEEIVRSFLKYSNNFVANQVFLRCGVERYGGKASWEKGRRAVNGSLAKLLEHETAAKMHIVEGSGLSRENRITAVAMLRVLELFKPQARLLDEKKHAAIKSGTLDGVYNYAGYLADGRSFVILLNQPENTRDALLQRLREQ